MTAFETITRKHRCEGCSGSLGAEPEEVTVASVAWGTLIFLTLFLGIPFVLLVLGQP